MASLANCFIASVSAAVGARNANAVLIDGTTEETNPEVELARARRDQARVNLERTVIRAPVEGVVARRSVQVGQQVQTGTPVLVIVPVAEIRKRFWDVEEPEQIVEAAPKPAPAAS